MAEKEERDTGKGGDRKSQSHDVTVKLSDLNISNKQSSRWQQESSLPEEEFEEYVAEVKGAGEELTSASVLRKAREYNRPKTSESPPLL